MVNYAQSKIYRIICYSTGKQYIGSCTTSLSARLSVHKQQLKNGKSCSSYDVLENRNFEIILLEDYPCERREQRNARERFWIDQSEMCVNKNIPSRTRREYYQDNRERLIEYQMKWNNENRPRLGIYRKIRRQVLDSCEQLGNEMDLEFDEIYTDESPPEFKL